MRKKARMIDFAFFLTSPAVWSFFRNGCKEYDPDNHNQYQDDYGRKLIFGEYTSFSQRNKQRRQHQVPPKSHTFQPETPDLLLTLVVMPVEFLCLSLVSALERPDLRCGTSFPVLRLGRFNWRLFGLCGLLFNLNRSVLFEIVRRSRFICRDSFPNPRNEEQTAVFP